MPFWERSSNPVTNISDGSCKGFLQGFDFWKLRRVLSQRVIFARCIGLWTITVGKNRQAGSEIQGFLHYAMFVKNGMYDVITYERHKKIIWHLIFMVKGV